MLTQGSAFLVLVPEWNNARMVVVKLVFLPVFASFYLVKFENGVSVITARYVHNLIKMRRYLNRHT